MSVHAVLNVLRRRAIGVSREFKQLFYSEEGPISAAGEHVLADLREYCFAEKSTFDPDPYIAARRQGRRDVWLRIFKYLNLDEAKVQEYMEIDDGT